MQCKKCYNTMRKKQTNKQAKKKRNKKLTKNNQIPACTIVVSVKNT